jgi:hypothetical protein
LRYTVSKILKFITAVDATGKRRVQQIFILAMLSFCYKIRVNKRNKDKVFPVTGSVWPRGWVEV